MHNERCTSGSERGRGKPVTREDYKALAPYSTWQFSPHARPPFICCPCLHHDDQSGCERRRSSATSRTRERSCTRSGPRGSSVR